MPALGFLRLWVWAGALTLSATLVAQDAKESPPKPLPVPEVGTPVRVRVSEKISQTLLVAKVPPHYPDEARAKHIEGSVVLVTEISPEGAVESMKVVSGDSLLATAATEAVEAVEIQTLSAEPQANRGRNSSDGQVYAKRAEMNQAVGACTIAGGCTASAYLY